MKIYIATGNNNKKREFSQLLPEYTIVTPTDEGIAFDPDETGTTFYENSMIKALALWNIVHQPVLADDSGICVDALNGIPGIYSARYAGADFPKGSPDGKKIPQEQKNAMLIEQLNNALATKNIDTSHFPHGERSCHYTCSMVLLLNPDRFFIAQETMEGCIIPSIEQAAGDGGFGYDPIVKLPQYNKTVAQLTADEKNAISHRGKALRTVISVLKSIKF